jgi:inner membrane protein
MNKQFTSTGISIRLWLFTSLFMAGGVAIGTLFAGSGLFALPVFIVGSIIALIVSLPALAILCLFIPAIKNAATDVHSKCLRLVILLAVISMGYAVIPAAVSIFRWLNFYEPGFLTAWLICAALIFCCCFLAFLIYPKEIKALFFKEPTHSVIRETILFQQQKNTIQMEYSTSQAPVPAHSNRILIKGLITGGLILLMLVPTLFIQSLITEREARQKEIVKEVSSKWASAQTLSGPYISVPLKEVTTGSDGKLITTTTQLILPADKLVTDGKVFPEERPRSIYKVLLYRAAIDFSGSFKTTWPADVDPASIDFPNAKLCFNLTDFKGIEEEVTVNFNNQNLLFNPGVPATNLGDIGLSVPVAVTAASMTAGIPFNMHLKIKGSEQLHFIPMSINSRYTLSSAWPSPSFDGNTLPSQREITDSGFHSQWSFNRANLSFGSVVRQADLKVNNMAFGVSMVQPADQYNKTMRSVKYAILLIGLSFALFFIIELMQKKPFHPVQYALVGMALVIFYSLLLSISEYILFDIAYLIAASATVLLITLYAQSHFENWKTASVFGVSLTALYGFIFILIRLEDTALLVGSIGLFIVLAVVMYVSRKISWYGNTEPKAVI